LRCAAVLVAVATLAVVDDSCTKTLSSTVLVAVVVAVDALYDSACCCRWLCGDSACCCLRQCLLLSM
jgi:hypothetical protein